MKSQNCTQFNPGLASLEIAQASALVRFPGYDCCCKTRRARALSDRTPPDLNDKIPESSSVDLLRLLAYGSRVCPQVVGLSRLSVLLEAVNLRQDEDC